MLTTFRIRFSELILNLRALGLTYYLVALVLLANLPWMELAMTLIGDEFEAFFVAHFMNYNNT